MSYIKTDGFLLGNDFLIVYAQSPQADQEEPHRTRRQLIQKAHPEVCLSVVC